MKSTKFKWNEDLARKAQTDYQANPNRGTVEAIAQAMGTSYKSVVGKLVQMGVYHAPAKEVKQPKNEGPTKKELLANLAETGFNVEGLEGATKAALARVLAELQTNAN